MTRVALDSNILAYLAGVSRSAEDEPKIVRVRELIGRLGNNASLIAPTQTLGDVNGGRIPGHDGGVKAGH